MSGKIWCLICRSDPLCFCKLWSFFWFSLGVKVENICQRCSKDADSSCGVVDPCLENMMFHDVQWCFPTKYCIFKGEIAVRVRCTLIYSVSFLHFFHKGLMVFGHQGFGGLRQSTFLPGRAWAFGGAL